jgi:hypothetical protein
MSTEILTTAEHARKELDAYRKAIGKRPTTMNDEQVIRTMVEYGVDLLMSRMPEEVTADASAHD